MTTGVFKTPGWAPTAQTLFEDVPATDKKEAFSWLAAISRVGIGGSLVQAIIDVNRIGDRIDFKTTPNTG